MALALGCYIESILPQASLGPVAAICTRLCCFSSRRKGSETFEDDCHFPVTGPTLQQPNFEEDPLWSLFRKIPGTMLWMTILATIVLPHANPAVLGYLVVIAMAQNVITLSFSLLYTYRGFKRIEEAMSNPVKIPALIEPASENANAASPSGEGSPESSTPADAIATPVEDVIQAAQVLHIVAICRCTEPVEVLEETIDHLAAHSNRANYIILLCLEAKDKHAAAVGESLVRKYAGVFFRVMYAIHPSGMEWEVPGKSANVNWGARAAYASLEADMGARALERMVITVADCDAKVSEHYFNELSVRFAAACREKREVFWAPPMLFDEEAADLAAEMAGAMAPPPQGDVTTSLFKTDPIEMLLGRTGKAAVRALIGGAIPGPVKIADQTWSMFVLQNLTSVNWVRLPCSTYSVGLKLIASVGYWDAGVESVPEDYHTALKLYWGTSGRCRCEPIYHPVLYQHIDAGSWFNTVYQRFQQGVRHMWGATDVAYITWLAKKIPTVPWPARLRLLLTVYDVHVQTGMNSFLSTFAFAFMTVLRPGWLGMEGKGFYKAHESMVIVAFTLSSLIGCVYEWYAKEMVAALKRPMPIPPPSQSSPGHSPSSLRGSPSVHAHLSDAGSSSPVVVEAEGGLTVDTAGVSSSLGGSGTAFVTIDAGLHNGPHATAYPGSPPRERSPSASLPRGRIAIRDRSFLGSMATCTATSVWQYILTLIPWVWSPVCVVLYLLGTAATAQTKLLWTNRMRPHVSPKTVPTPSATPRQQSALSNMPGSSTPVSRMQSLSGAAESWEAARQANGVPTPQAGAAGRSIRLQLPSAAYGGSRNPSSGQFSSLMGGLGAVTGGSPHVTPRYGGTAEQRDGGGSPGRHAAAWA